MSQKEGRPAGNGTASKSLVGDFDQHTAVSRQTDRDALIRRAMGTAARVLAKCKCNDPTVSNPNREMLLAWAEHIVEAGLQDHEDLLLQAVTRVYSTRHDDNFRLRPWNVISAAREMREEAAMREPDAARQARQAVRDRALAAAESAAESAAAADGMVRIPRGASALIVACRHEPCRAGVGRPCTVAAGRHGDRVMVYSRAHPNRIARAAAEREHDNPAARHAAAEAARQDAARALAEYAERHQHPPDMDSNDRAALYRLAEQLAARPAGGNEAPPS